MVEATKEHIKHITPLFVLSPAAISSMDKQIRNLQNPGSFGTGNKSRWGWEKSLWPGSIWPMQISVHSCSEIFPPKAVVSNQR